MNRWASPIFKKIAQTQQRQILADILIELTQNCNERCVHCYNFDRSKPAPKNDRPAMRTQEILNLLRQARECGVLWLTLSGGEPLLHRDFKAIVEAARKLYFDIRIKTNGTLLSSRWIDFLSEQRVSNIDVSLYGAKSQTHDEFTKKPGSYQKTIEGIERSIAAKIEVEVSFIVHKNSVNELSQAKRQLTEMGAQMVFAPQISARHDGTRESLEYSISNQQWEELLRGPMAEEFDPGLRAPGDYGCACGSNKLAIGYDGQVYPCIGAPMVVGDIRQSSLDHIWKKSPELQWIRNLKPSDYIECQGCTLQKFCQRSSGVALVNAGAFTAKDLVECERAKVLERVYQDREQSPLAQ